MINAEATAENKPACDPSEHAFVQTSTGTHEDQGRVQVPAMFLEKFAVVLLRHIVIACVEMNPVIIMSRNFALRAILGCR